MLGERSSGTNLARRLLARNTPLAPSDVLGWKHGFPSMLAIPADLAVICMVRNAADWALSMHAKPWHATASLQALPFSDFIRAPWHSTIDRARYFPGAEELVGQSLQQDRDPLTGAPFANLFELRRAKLAALLGYAARGCTCVVLRVERLQADPQGAIDEIAGGLGLAARDARFRPVGKRLGARFKPVLADRPPTPDSLTPADLRFLQRHCDTQQEAALGYVY
ncbi:hypothetical protein [Sedimentitalea arenosa]|uniref:hypothetical protein n=1 Tax=Sedimentitalea arenosa TaxID=2798803 RepID=UPI002E27E4FC|nr:hypothetical protein [Arenibacterium arenosum]